MERVLFEGGAGGDEAKVTVCIPLHNYQGYIADTLDSVRRQDLRELELVIVDDVSTDDSVAVALDWLRVHAGRFRRALLLQPENNGGLPLARNLAAQKARSGYLFFLDADNLLFPRCLRRCLEALEGGDAALAYTIIERFGGAGNLMSQEAWTKERFLTSNYVDAMAMVRRDRLLDVGGYREILIGWEDYDLWCRFVERGFHGVLVPEILCRYRVHGGNSSATVRITNAQRAALYEDMRRRHPWLRLG